MNITLIGSVGFGLVWGWLLGSLGGRVQRPQLVGWSAGAATLVVAAVVRWYTDRRSLWFFLGAAGLSLLLHLGWREELRRRYRSSR